MSPRQVNYIGLLLTFGDEGLKKVPGHGDRYGNHLGGEIREPPSRISDQKLFAVWHWRRQGWSGKAIAKQLGIGKTTVFRDLASPQFPKPQGRSDRSQG